EEIERLRSRAIVLVRDGARLGSPLVAVVLGGGVVGAISLGLAAGAGDRIARFVNGAAILLDFRAGVRGPLIAIVGRVGQRAAVGLVQAEQPREEIERLG